ncbi:MAG TPA: adenylate/guanylate cyclase domain-containing protein [Gammaproteobacteria bacterium]|nr:adenylate/guanylate cyclase domain-containing protein [Gammaproteobacteria bacterium]
MLKFLKRRLKTWMVTLRFSILSIFVALFISSILTLITITHVRFVDSMERLSFSLMQQASTTAFNQVQNLVRNAELKSYTVAQLITLGVVNFQNDAELFSYMTHFIKNEIGQHSGIQVIAWGDASGSFIMSERKENGTIYSEIIERDKKPPYHKSFTQNIEGKVIAQTSTNDFSYDPRNRPWYIAAMTVKKPIWLGVYYYILTGHQGSGVSTPVFDKNGKLQGVVTFQIRLDNLQRLVERTQVSKNSLVFIVSTEGKVIAFPKENLLDRESLFGVRELSATPWIAESFDIYKKTRSKTFDFTWHHTKYLATYQPLLTSSDNKEKWLIGIVVPADDFISDLNQTHLITLLINLGILILGIILVSILITRVVRPLKKITSEIIRIKHFHLSGELHVKSRIKEISYIADALTSMKKGLRTFQRYIPATLVRQLIETGEDARIGGIKKPLAIFFSDIRDFTSIAEEVDPDELTRHLFDYFDALSHIIVLNNGTIDKYIGDAIMAFWGAPQPLDQPALYAARTALRCIARSNELNRQWHGEGKPVLYTRIGIHFGETIVGNLGSSERFNYTAIGDTPNTASRLEGINKLYGTQIIVSNAVYQQIKNHFILRMVDRVAVKGKHEYTDIYELIAETREEVSYDLELYSLTFAKGYTAYKNNYWDEAIDHFKKCLAIYPEDTVAPVFIERCLHFKFNPPPADWSGIWQLHEK